MRYGPDDKFWVVVDPTAESEMGDILFETTLRGLERQFKGGLTAMRAAQAVLRAGLENPSTQIDRIDIYGADGKLVFEANCR